ncbi:MAG: M48 family metallopeptidase [Alphaproteobacteria bacterium]|jgi:predicted metal-dependent hydrolase|nr:M48 family metallopeptidase [Alphaproteobacteria bacterium]
MLGIRLWSEKLRVAPGKIMVTNPAKRWASCDHRNNLRFNWRVMMVPSSLIDYVVAHELCHVVHKNHSPDFWRLLGSIMPDYGQRKVALKKYGQNLDL